MTTKDSKQEANDAEKLIAEAASIESLKAKKLLQEEANDKSIGHWLHRARQSKGVEVTDAAKELRLSARIIHALEADDFSKLGQVVFIRGYLRAYARYLNLRDDVIIDKFNHLDFQENLSDHKVKMKFVQRKIEASHSKKWFYWMSLFIIFVILAMTLTWWYQRAEQEHRVSPAKKMTAVSEMPVENTQDKALNEVLSSEDNTVLPAQQVSQESDGNLNLAALETVLPIDPLAVLEKNVNKP